jgi:hypothetical protein
MYVKDRVLQKKRSIYIKQLNIEETSKAKQTQVY